LQLSQKLSLNAGIICRTQNLLMKHNTLLCFALNIANYFFAHNASSLIEQVGWLWKMKIKNELLSSGVNDWLSNGSGRLHQS
jgi:hypothetical protein